MRILAFPPTSNNWFALNLGASNRDVDVYGGTVTLETDTLTITRALAAPQHFLSQGDPRIHFGLGRSKRVKRLTIEWRDGSSSAYDDLLFDGKSLANFDSWLVNHHSSDPERVFSVVDQIEAHPLSASAARSGAD